MPRATTASDMLTHAVGGVRTQRRPPLDGLPHSEGVLGASELSRRCWVNQCSCVVIAEARCGLLEVQAPAWHA